MARKDIFAGLGTETPKREAKAPTYHGAARSLVDSIHELSARSGYQEIDPGLIDPSPFRDRLPDDDNLAFEEFKKSMADEGQKVPVQVRPHPTEPGRYQLVYGHRRVRAARELGLQIKAIPLEISDAELVVAQGIENGARQDLSWIERALFAKTMDEAGVKARDIYAALSINDTALWQMRNVYQLIPTDIVEMIGRAPKVGRPRWTELAKAIEQNKELIERLRKNLTAVRSVDSNQRFQAALDAVQEKATPKVRDHQIDGLGSLRFTASTPRGREFAQFIAAKLPGLIEMFQKGEN